jgi:hypothetical protein
VSRDLAGCGKTHRALKRERVFNDSAARVPFPFHGQGRVFSSLLDPSQREGGDPGL